MFAGVIFWTLATLIREWFLWFWRIGREEQTFDFPIPVLEIEREAEHTRWFCDFRSRPGSDLSSFGQSDGFWTLREVITGKRFSSEKWVERRKYQRIANGFWRGGEGTRHGGVISTF
jgi:hypothetical protein